jgi:hypothetical protein
MKVDLDGLAESIKEAIKGDRASELRFMVDEMVWWEAKLSQECRDKLAAALAAEKGTAP